MARYSVFVDRDVIASLPKPDRQRRSIMDFVSSLAEDPHSRADYTEPDPSGRTLEVKIIGRHAITYWLDHAVKEVKIVYLQPSGR